jgi:hypothetical protein
VEFAVDVEGRKVAAHVGQDLTDRGLRRAQITQVIGATFMPPARAGKYDFVALALAQGLVTWRSPAVGAGPIPSSPVKKDSSSGVGLFLLLAFGFGWLLFRVAAGGLPARSARGRAARRPAAAL